MTPPTDLPTYKSLHWTTLSLAMLLLVVTSLQVVAQPPAEKPVEAPADPHAAILQKADEAYRKGNFPAVIEITEGVVKQNSKNHLALYLLGSAQVETGIRTSNLKMVREGISHSRTAISLLKKLEPNYYMPYLYGMTNLTIMEGQPEHAKVAVQVASQVLKQTEKVVDGEKKSLLTKEQLSNILFQRGMARLQLGDFDGTIKDYETALKATPKHMGVMMAMADAYVASGKDAAARLTFNRVVDEFPKNALAFNNRGMFLQSIGKSDDAILDFTKAISLDPKMFVAMTNRGFAKLSKNNPIGAEKDFTISLDIEKNQPSTYSLRGTSRLNQGKSKEAMKDYKKVTEFSKRNPLAYADLGFAAFFSKDYKVAAEAFQDALMLDKKMIYLRPWTYTSKILSGDIKGASSFIDPLAKLEKKDRQWPDRLSLYLMGRIPSKDILSNLGDDIKGKPDAQKSRQCEAYFFVGQRTLNMGDTEKAKEYFQKAIDTGAEQLSAYRGAQYALGKF